MTLERLRSIETIFHSARELNRATRTNFLNEACADDEELRREVESLLKAHESADTFITRSAPEIAAEVLAKEQAALAIGRMFGHYMLLEPLGRGGMGEVYLAEDTRSGRKAALKLLPLRYTGDAERFHRFQREARTVIGLNHPNIVTIYEIGEENSTHYIVSELIEGETLQHRLARGRMELGEALDIALQVVSALGAAHRAGIIHRDIKPDNIMLRPDGYVKVLDFGVAKLAEESEPTALTREEAPRLLVETSIGRVLGTARYMSPEQASGLIVDERTDIWSLGIVLYEMVAGSTPFTIDTPDDVIASLSKSATPNPGLQQILVKALRKERAARYWSIDEMGMALKKVRRDLEAEKLTKPRWRKWAATVSLVVVFVGLFYWTRSRSREGESIPSIAVLPFENFSDDKANAFFAQGIQDEILTALSKISGLKVISRTSTASFKSKPRNLSEIARELGASNILEGSVQKAGDRVHVNVQLIRAKTGAHLWAQSYDKTLTDAFMVEGEVAKSVAESLKAALTPQELAQVGTKPTNNPDAYVAYLRAVEIIHRGVISLRDYEAAARSLEEAIALDPGFALAHARLSRTYGLIGHFFEPGETRRDQALAEANEALRLQPNLGEGHQALALCHYWGRHDYPAALAELAIAKKVLPNDSGNPLIEGAIARRQGRWREAIEHFQRALALDPRSIDAAVDIQDSYICIRDWPAALQANKQLLAVLEGQSPELVLDQKLNGAYLLFAQTGKLDPIRAVAEQAPADLDPDGMITLARYDVALLERDFAGAERALEQCKRESFPSPEGDLSKLELVGMVRRARGDPPAELAANFEQAIRKLEEELQSNPNDAARHARLGLRYSFIGRKEDALREGRRATELVPTSDEVVAAQTEAVLAQIYAQVGEVKLAIPLLEHLLTRPGPVIHASVSITQAELRFRWEWDPLRKDVGFQKLLAGPEPKTIF